MQILTLNDWGHLMNIYIRQGLSYPPLCLRHQSFGVDIIYLHQVMELKINKSSKCDRPKNLFSRSFFLCLFYTLLSSWCIFRCLLSSCFCAIFRSFFCGSCLFTCASFTFFCCGIFCSLF